MFQTWPSHEAYMADVAWQNEQEARVRKYSLEKCVHEVSMTSGCEKCGALMGKTCTRPVSFGEVAADKLCGEPALVAMSDVVPYLVENRARWDDYLAELVAGASSLSAGRGLVHEAQKEMDGFLCQEHYEESRLTWK
jgi:hypothetical protein